MQYIKSIEIQYFRSIYRQTISNCSDLNVFTGKNDAGKSNILKALNLFFNNKTDANTPFNFLEDFNNQRLEEVRRNSIKGKQFIQIKVTFNRGSISSKTLPKTFTVAKKWLRNDSFPSITDNIEKQLEKENKKYNDRSKSSLTAFLNKFKYIYIPAIKDYNTFNSSINELQDCIYNQKLSTDIPFEEALNLLSDKVSSTANEINDEFEKVTGIKSSLTTPQKLNELYKTMHVTTKYRGNNIDLNKRGDGIRVRYLPSILNYIAKESKKRYIWGFEEPENSLEYNMTLSMADSFVFDYSKKSNIFITSHSPAFISLLNNNTKVYRCINSKKGTIVFDINKGTPFSEDYPDLANELGYVKLQQEFYKKYKQEYEQNLIHKKEIKSLTDKIRKAHKPTVVTEGKTDASILATAWSKLYNYECPFEISPCEVGNDTESFAGCSMLRQYLKSYLANSEHIVIGLFENDSAGIKEYQNLGKNFITSNNKKFKISKNKKAYATLLPVPTGKENFEKNKNLCIEFLFEKSDLEKEVDGIKLILKPGEIIKTTANGLTIGRELSNDFSLYQIDKSTKSYFAEKIVPTFDKSSFIHFELVFNRIIEIIDSSKL